MSDNGPYIQPPQFPQDGEGNSEGQPPYGGAPYGQPGYAQGAPDAGQQHPSGPHQPPYGGPGPGGPPPGGPGPGGQPNPPYGASPGPGGPPYPPPQEQQMYQGGGAPPYGPSGPANSPGYPQQPRKSSAGMWIVIGGGAVIVILVIAVVAVVLRNSGDGGEQSAQGGSGDEEQQGDKGGGSEKSEEEEGSDDEGGGGEASGEPPYELPEEPCDSLSEDAAETYGMDTPNKSLTDNNSSCSWSVDGEGDTYGTVRVEYSVPYGGADSVEGAESDFQDNVDYATNEDDSYTERKVHEQEDVDLGDEAKLVFATESTISNDSVSTMLVRTENMNIEVRYALMPGLGADDDTPAPLEFSDVEEMMNDLGSQAVDHVGS